MKQSSMKSGIFLITYGIVLYLSLSHLGLTGFAPDESFLGAEGYLLSGRAVRSMPHLLLWQSYADGNGRTLVKAEIYTDHLNTQNCQGYLFAFAHNADGSLRLISVT